MGYGSLPPQFSFTCYFLLLTGLRNVYKYAELEMGSSFAANESPWVNEGHIDAGFQRFASAVGTATQEDFGSHRTGKSGHGARPGGKVLHFSGYGPLRPGCVIVARHGGSF